MDLAKIFLRVTIKVTVSGSATLFLCMFLIVSPIAGSGPSSANTTYIPSGDSTKTVVSQFDQSGTLKADDLAGKLEAIANELGI